MAILVSFGLDCHSFRRKKESFPGKIAALGDEKGRQELSFAFRIKGRFRISY